MEAGGEGKHNGRGRFVLTGAVMGRSDLQGHGDGHSLRQM
jgi:hypothetical protein